MSMNFCKSQHNEIEDKKKSDPEKSVIFFVRVFCEYHIKNFLFSLRVSVGEITRQPYKLV